MTPYVPPGLHDWDPASKARLVAAVPMPLAELLDPDGFGRGLAFVAQEGDRRLYTLGSKLLWATVRGDDVVDVAFPEGLDAHEALVAHHWHLPEPLAARLRASVVPGALLEDALTAALGPRRPGLAALGDDDAPPGERRTVYRVSSVGPSRTAVLDVLTDSAGRVREARLLEGRPGWERLAAMMFRSGRWPVKR